MKFNQFRVLLVILEGNLHNIINISLISKCHILFQPMILQLMYRLLIINETDNYCISMTLPHLLFSPLEK